MKFWEKKGAERAVDFIDGRLRTFFSEPFSDRLSRQGASPKHELSARARGSLKVKSSHRRAGPWLAWLLLAAACQAPSRAAPLDPTASPAAVPSSVSATESDAVAPDLDQLAWDDRSPFRAGLVAAQQPTLDKLPSAPAYDIAIAVTD